VVDSLVATHRRIELTFYPGCPLCDFSDAPIICGGDCSGRETYREGVPRSVVWKRCAACGHIFRDGYFSGDSLQAVLGRTMVTQTVGVAYEAVRLQVERTIDLVLPFERDGIWLDVGFGDGSLLRTVKEFGFSPRGIDLRRPNVEALLKLGIGALCAGVDEIHADPPCRVISMQYVLAHLPYPRAALASAHRLLGDNGVLVVSTPNTETSLWEQWEREGKNPYWGEIECCHHFGKNRLYALLREQGFEPVRYAIGQRYRSCMEVVARKVSGDCDAAQAV
jgi:SAM-dependent methyltransferase